jgi:outer membrane protein assembly factor BamB
MSKKKLFIHALALLSLFVLSCGLSATLMTPTPAFTPTPAPNMVTPNVVETPSLNLVEQWRFSTGFSIFFYSTPSFLHLSRNKVITGYHVDLNTTNPGAWLTALSLDDGRIVWQTYIPPPDFGINVSTSKQDNERIYLLYSFQVHAFDLETGQQVWVTPNLGEHTSYLFNITSSNPLKLLTSNSEMLDLDPTTGTLLARRPLEKYEGFVNYEKIAFYTTRQELIALDLSVPIPLWTRANLQPANRQLCWWPTFMGDEMLYQSGGPLYQILRLNVYTGAVRWETAWEYVSNYVLAGDKVYALRQDGALVTLDAFTGAVLEEIKFEHPFENIGSRVFYVATAEPYVVVYLGDSQEVIAFKEMPP